MTTETREGRSTQIRADRPRKEVMKVIVGSNPTTATYLIQ